MAQRTVLDDREVMVGDMPPLVLQGGKMTPGDATVLSNTIRALVEKVNGKVSHGTGITGHRGNLDEQFVDVIMPGANVELAVPHGLGRFAIGFLVVDQDRAGSFYSSSRGSWNLETIYIKCSVASVVAKIVVF